MSADGSAGPEPKAPEYVLGRSENESRRLIEQADLLRGLSENVFRGAGLAPGMRVLDLGCGTGDVAFLAAELVGPEGAVVGVDVAPGVLETARRRLGERGLANVSFVEQAFESLSFSQPFDAVVGRLFLMYQPDPVAAVRRAAGFVRPGGIVVFHEADFTAGMQSWPQVELWQRCGEWVEETFRRGGVHTDMGMRLYSTFHAAGLPAAEISHSTLAGGGEGLPFYGFFVTVIRSLLPRMQALGVVSAEEVQLDTLAERLESQVVAARAQVATFSMVGAWARKLPPDQSPASRAARA